MLWVSEGGVPLGFGQSQAVSRASGVKPSSWSSGDVIRPCAIAGGPTVREPGPWCKARRQGPMGM